MKRFSPEMTEPARGPSTGHVALRRLAGRQRAKGCESVTARSALDNLKTRNGSKVKQGQQHDRCYVKEPEFL